MLILRLYIMITRLKIYVLDKLSFLPSSIKTKYANEIYNDIVKITNKLRLQKII